MYKGNLDIIIKNNNTTITLRDENSSLIINEITISNEMFMQALGRRGCCECSFDIIGEDSYHKIGKHLIVDKLRLSIPAGFSYSSIGSENYIKLCELIDSKCPDGWKADHYFGGRNSFVFDGEKWFVNVTIRKWE